MFHKCRADIKSDWWVQMGDVKLLLTAVKMCGKKNWHQFHKWKHLTKKNAKISFQKIIFDNCFFNSDCKLKSKYWTEDFFYDFSRINTQLHQMKWKTWNWSVKLSIPQQDIAWPFWPSFLMSKGTACKWWKKLLYFPSCSLKQLAYVRAFRVTLYLLAYVCPVSTNFFLLAFGQNRIEMSIFLRHTRTGGTASGHVNSRIFFNSHFLLVFLRSMFILNRQNFISLTFFCHQRPFEFHN